MMNLRYIPFFCIATSLLMFGCSDNSTDKQEKTSGTDTIPVFTLKKVNLKKDIAFPGELIPFEKADIFAKVSGYVKTIQVDIGDVVQKGQVIAMLEAPEMLASYAQVNSDLQTSKSKYNSSLDAYKRILNAAKIEGTIAQGEMERSKNQMLADSSAYEAAKAKLNTYGQLKDYLTIQAPFNGIITQRNVDPGTLVGTSNTKPMFVIENSSSLRLRLPIPEAYTSSNLSGSVVKFTSDAYPGEFFEAKLSRKSGALNLTNRTETWEFLYDNKEGKLKSGMFANATVNFGRTNSSFVVPSTAIVTNLEKRFVIRLNNGKTEWVDVRNGINITDSTEIFGNLAEGDLLIFRASDEIKPDKKVVPKLK